MRGLIQRVSSAEVEVDKEMVGKIDRGILLLLGIEKSDQLSHVERLLNKVTNYRIFPDDQGHMNKSLLDIAGELLVVSQFTIAADTKKGLRPSFSSAAPPQLAEDLYHHFVRQAEKLCPTQTGVFAADMKVTLTNDGPVTFMLSV